MKYTPGDLEKLKAIYGEDTLLCFSKGESDFVVKRPDAKTTKLTLEMRAEKNPAWSEILLRRSVVGLDDLDTQRAKKELEALMEIEPQILDNWGIELAKSVGFMAKVHSEQNPDQSYTLYVTVGSDVLELSAKPLNRAQWKEVRSLIYKGEDRKATSHTFDLCCTVPQKDSLIEKYPELPYSVGNFLASLGTEVGNTPKKL